MTASMQKTTFTLAEAAELLSCHKETLRRAIGEGALRAARLGREYRISRSDLEIFWSSRGGGELFGKESAPETPAQVAGEPRQADAGREKPQKPDGPQQLTLLG